MSFSGLKTALLRTRDGLIEAQGGLFQSDIDDICAGFQSAVGDVLVEKTNRALDECTERLSHTPTLAVAGGVAANAYLGDRLRELCAARDIQFIAPPLRLCTDNAAMIAYTAGELYQLGITHGMDLSARPRWPLDTAQPALLGSGKKGAKA